MLKRYPLAWYTTWIVMLVILPAPLIVILHLGLEVSPKKLLIYDFGVVCYVWWLVSVGLSARPSWLDRLIGLPELYFMHALLGVFSLATGTVHVFTANTHKPIVYWTGQIAWYLAVFGLCYAIFFLSGWVVERVPMAHEAKRRMNRFFTHQLSVWIHRLHFVVIALVLVHVHVVKQIANVTMFLVVIDCYTAIAIGMYVWAKWIQPQSKARRGYVLSNSPLNRDTHQLVLRLDERAPAYEPGDFYFLSFRGVKGLSTEPHPFSATFTPEKEADRIENQSVSALPTTTRMLTFTIRELGDFTQHIGSVPVDTTVRLEGPFGRFNRVLRDDPLDQRLVLIGMGTGIAPILSLAVGYAPKRPTTIFHTVHAPEDFYYVDDFEELAATYPDVVYHHKVHRYEPEALKTLLGDDLITARYVIVGGASAVLAMHKCLVRLGVPAHQVIDERLTM